jgi:hypothetical protein
MIDAHMVAKGINGPICHPAAFEGAPLLGPARSCTGATPGGDDNCCGFHADCLMGFDIVVKCGRAKKRSKPD